MQFNIPVRSFEITDTAEMRKWVQHVRCIWLKVENMRNLMAYRQCQLYYVYLVVARRPITSSTDKYMQSPKAVIPDDCSVADNGMLSARHFQPVSKQVARPWPTLKEAACLQSAWGWALFKMGALMRSVCKHTCHSVSKELKLYQENDWPSVWANIVIVTVLYSCAYVDYLCVMA